MGHKNKQVNSASGRRSQFIRGSSQSKSVACDLVQFLIRYRFENRYRNQRSDGYNEWFLRRYQIQYLHWLLFYCESWNRLLRILAQLNFYFFTLRLPSVLMREYSILICHFQTYFATFSKNIEISRINDSMEYPMNLLSFMSFRENHLKS